MLLVSNIQLKKKILILFVLSIVLGLLVVNKKLGKNLDDNYKRKTIGEEFNSIDGVQSLKNSQYWPPAYYDSI